MSWTETTRLQYRRKGLRYSSDMLDAEWELIAPFVAEDRRLGRPRATVLRAVVKAIFYIATTGCQWRMLPKEFPPYSTVQRYFYRWRDTGTWEPINHTLLMQARAAAGREASPNLPLQTGRGNRQPVGQIHRGGRPARVRRRQENQRPQAPHHHRYGRPAGRGHRPWRRGSEPAPAQAGDRDGAVPLLASIRSSFPWRRHVFADAGYAGAKLETALAKLGRWTVEIVKRPHGTEGFTRCRGAGWSSAPSLGSTATAGWPKILKPPLKAPLPG